MDMSSESRVFPAPSELFKLKNPSFVDCFCVCHKSWFFFLIRVNDTGAIIDEMTATQQTTLNRMLTL